MPRIYQVPKSRTEHTCGRCNEVIPAGAPYRHATRYRSATMIRCMKKGCRFRNSDLSGSKTAIVEDAVEDALEAIRDSDLDGIKDAMSSVSQTASYAAEEYREANDTWTQNGGPDNEEWISKAEACEEFAEACDNWEPDEDLSAEEIYESAVEVLNEFEGST